MSDAQSIIEFIGSWREAKGIIEGVDLSEAQIIEFAQRVHRPESQ